MTERGVLQGYRVLVVEDEYYLANDLEKALTEEGAQVLGPFGDLDEAKEQILEDGFEMAVLDINLHGHKAYEIADVLTLQGIPFVFATGYGEYDIPLRFKYVRRWQKPFDAGHLAKDVHNLCRAMSAQNKPKS